MGILDPGTTYTLRPMKYPQFYNQVILAQANTWTIEETSFSTDQADIREKLTTSERHIVSRLLAFFATGDNIVLDNLVHQISKHVNSPELAVYYARQAWEEGLHVIAYNILIDNYIPDVEERDAVFQSIHTIPSIKRKAEFCKKWMDTIKDINTIETHEDRKKYLINVITFASAVEGLFFFGAFSYIYYLRGVKKVLNGLGAITNWVFRDESMHMETAFLLVDVIRQEYPELFDSDLTDRIKEMLAEAIECEMQFAEDTLSLGVAGLTSTDMRQYLQYIADQRLARLRIEPVYNSKNPFPFMVLQDLSPVTNFFEKTVTEYTIGFDTDTKNITLENVDF
jgi:ribonucleoside-diphosphate reductase beta chain